MQRSLRYNIFVWVSAGSGRTAWSSGTKQPDVVGSVILHDKLDLWKSSKGSVHYHQGNVHWSPQKKFNQ